MRQVMSISMEDTLKAKIEEAAARLHVSKSELVKKAVEKYIAHEELENIRAMLLPLAEKAGLYTDEDVFAQIS